MTEEENLFSDEDFMNEFSGSEPDPDKDEVENKTHTRMRMFKYHLPKRHTGSFKAAQEFY